MESEVGMATQYKLCRIVASYKFYQTILHSVHSLESSHH